MCPKHLIYTHLLTLHDQQAGRRRCHYTHCTDGKVRNSAIVWDENQAQLELLTAQTCPRVP